MAHRDDGPALFKMGKVGVLRELDPKTVDYRAAHDLGHQDIVDIHPTSGPGDPAAGTQSATERPGRLLLRPGRLKNLWATGYHAETGAFYTPLMPGCARSTFKPMPVSSFLVESGTD